MKLKTSFVGLDVARGIAAIAVVISHYRALIFVDYQHADARGVWKAAYFLSGFGHEAVMAFFVLSGILISRSVDFQSSEKKFIWRKYLIDRLVRLELVLIPAIIIGAMWDYLGLKVSSFPEVYTKAFGLSGAANTEKNLSLINAVGNILFLQPNHVPTFGSNGPLWSLAYEFWYYILYAALISVLYSVSKFMRALWLIVIALIIWFIGAEMALYGLIWLLGSGVYYMSKKNTVSTPFICAGSIMSLFILTLIRVNIIAKGFTADLSLGLTFAILFVGLLADDGKVNQFASKIAKVLSERSYTCYLVHVPFGIWFSANTIGSSKILPSVRGLLIAGGFIGSFIIYNEIMYRLFEQNTKRCKQVLYNIFKIDKIVQS